MPTLLILSGVAYAAAIVLAFFKTPDEPASMRWLHRGIRWCAIGLPLGIVAGLGMMMLDHLLFKGSGWPFDWGPGIGIGWMAVRLSLTLAPLSGFLEIIYATIWLFGKRT